MVVNDMPLTDQDYAAVVAFVKQLQEQLPETLHGVVLYGSKARGEATIASDIDLLIILTNDAQPQRHLVSDIASDISVWHNVLILPHVISLSRWQEMSRTPYLFFRELFRDGWPLYGSRRIFEPLMHRHEIPLYETAAIA
jgi:predicted nucleotidyltransferase